MKSLLRRVTWPGCVYFGNLGALFTIFFDERFVGAGIVVTAPRQGGELKGFIHSPDKQNWGPSPPGCGSFCETSARYRSGLTAI